VFRALEAKPDLDETEHALAVLARATVAETVAPSDADDAVVRRLVDASVMPELLARETSAAALDATEADAAVVFVAPSADEIRVVAMAGCDEGVARALAKAAAQGNRAHGEGFLLSESLGRDHDGPRRCTVVAASLLTEPAMKRFRMYAAVARL